MATETRRLQPELLVDHLQDLVLKTEDVKLMLDDLANLTASTLSDPALVFCSITLMRQKKPLTVASSEKGAVRLDETQYRAGDGPCLTAIREETVIHVPDMSREHRWPDYAAAALMEKVGSSLSVPLVLSGEAEAGLNMYSTRSHGFSGEDIEKAESYAYHASKALRLAVKISQLAEAKNNLTAALQSRTVIDLAAGAIMAQNRCSQKSANEHPENRIQHPQRQTPGSRRLSASVTDSRPRSPDALRRLVFTAGPRCLLCRTAPDQGA